MASTSGGVGATGWRQNGKNAWQRKTISYQKRQRLASKAE